MNPGKLMGFIFLGSLALALLGDAAVAAVLMLGAILVVLIEIRDAIAPEDKAATTVEIGELSRFLPKRGNR